MPKIGVSVLRRQQLINAACQVIRDGGLGEATMASVADAAGLSTGIVAHYFGNKDGLLEATMRQLLRDLRNAVAYHLARVPNDTPRAQLQAIVLGNFDATQISADAMRVWLSFWSASLNQPDLARLQRANDKRLHSNLAYQFAKVLPREQARRAATGLAAVIDGLWLRGSLSGKFDPQQATMIAFDYIDQSLGQALESPAPSLPQRKAL